MIKGIVLGAAGVVVTGLIGFYAVISLGFMPANADGKPPAIEKWVARKALHATIDRLAPKGAKPGGVVAETQQYTAKITAINLKKRQATLLFPDNTTRTFTVRKDVDLSQRKVGEEVAFRVTMATAISVKKP